MSWVRRLFGLCEHKWEDYGNYQRYVLGTDHLRATVLVLKCVHCGSVKKVEMS